MAIHRSWAPSEGHKDTRNRVSHYKYLYVHPRPFLSLLWPEVVTENNHLALWATSPESLDPKPEQPVCILCYLQALPRVTSAQTESP